MTTRTAALPNPFIFAPPPSLKDQVEAIEAKIERLKRTAETGRDFAEITRLETEMLQLLMMSDPCHRGAQSIALASRLTAEQLRWASKHDWFDSVVRGALIVVDRFSYKGRSYEQRFVWGGTFQELWDWAGY